MKNIKKILSWKIIAPIEIVIGLLIFIIIFCIAANADMKSAENELRVTVDYMKTQCNESQIRDLASEAKSLLRVTESVDQIRWHLKYDKEIPHSKRAKENNLENYATDSYLDGLILLDKDGNVETAFDASGLGSKAVLDMTDRDSLMNLMSFTEDSYAIRVVLEDESQVDLAAVSRIDEDGVLVGYYDTSATYAATVNNSIRTIISGVSKKKNGTIVISSGNKIIISNDKKLEGTNVEDTPILNKIMKHGTGSKLTHAKDKNSVFGHQFGLMEKSRDYYIYAFMGEHNVFGNTFFDVLAALLFYVLFLIVVNTMMWRAGKIYRRNQLIAQRKYMDSLEEKNRQLQEAVLKAEKASMAKSSFLSRMSHDIRTPLNGIIGLLKIDEDHFEEKDLVRENHRKMQISANHLLSLINDVLQMSKLEDGSIVLTHEVVNLAELSKDVVSIVIDRAVEAGIKWEYKREKTFIPHTCIYGSPVHLRQIFLNIYGNCIKYTHSGGTITTVVDTLEEKDHMCTYRWTISDTGEGMDEEFLEHIFEPFTQEKNDARSVYQGTGLGMAIVKSLVDKMNGTISVTSKKGVGTTFVITIPFEIAPEPAVVEEDHTSKDMDIRGMNILLVEDNELNAEIAEIMLQDQGANVTVAYDGKQAVELFQENEEETFDAILMDVMMPVMDGITATKKIRESGKTDAKDIPIIAVTANAFKEDAEKCIAAGMNAHISKPLNMETIKETLKKLCQN